MLIRIPETPGIPAVLREIAALCPRHSPTAQQHGYSLSSSCCCCCCTSSPTNRRACEDARARDIYREHARGRTNVSQMVTLTFAHIFLLCLSPLPTLLRSCTLLSTSRGGKWKGRLTVARDISATLYDVQDVFLPWWFLENGNVEDLIE